LEKLKKVARASLWGNLVARWGVRRV